MHIGVFLFFIVFSKFKIHRILSRDTATEATDSNREIEAVPERNIGYRPTDIITGGSVQTRWT